MSEVRVTGAGRPKKEIDYVTVEKLANIQCTQEEIASFLGITRATLLKDEKFRELFEKGKENGKASLRRIQWKHAEKSASMAIFLGKQYLGQRDNVEITNTDELNKVQELLAKIEKSAKND